MDKRLFFIINGDWSHPALDRSMAILSCLDFWVPILALALAWVAWRGGVRGRLAIFALALALGIGDGVVARHLKQATDRLRPRDTTAAAVVRELDETGPKVIGAWAGAFRPVEVHAAKPWFEKKRKSGKEPERPGGRSFPSAHVLNNFSAATAVVLIFGWRWAWLYAFGAAMAFSRVYVGAHWPSDAAASIPLGIAVGGIAVWVTQEAWERLGRRHFPKAFAQCPTLRRSQAKPGGAAVDGAAA
ncbi:MAG: phosphatase PAP2 family protein [Verrucomicrobiales bacterium]